MPKGRQIEMALNLTAIVNLYYEARRRFGGARRPEQPAGQALGRARD